MTARERLHWLFRLTVMLFILASVAFLSALTAMRFAIRGREVTTPNLLGTPVAHARQMLGGQHVGIEVEDRIYSHYPVDSVARQSPLPGMRVKVGQDVHVVLSLGPQQVTIPKLENASQRTAQIELIRDGLQLGEVSSLYLPGGVPDAVLQQNPAPGSTDATSPRVDLLVSLGPRPAAYVMPGLVGLPIGHAESLLETAGLKVSGIESVAVPGATRGEVVGQTPMRGRRVDDTTAIELEVAE